MKKKKAQPTPLQNFEKKIVDRQVLAMFISKKFKMNRKHVFNVINLFFEELSESFKQDREFYLDNFGKFYISHYKPSVRNHVLTGEKISCLPTKKLRFTFFRSIKKFVELHLDLDKTFPGEQVDLNDKN